MKTPRPPEWKLTVANWCKSNEHRLSPNDPDWMTKFKEQERWAMEYEISLLPADTVFPRVGQVWQIAEDCEIDSTMVFESGDALGGKTRLKKGEKFRITGLSDPPIMVNLETIQEQEDGVVPEEFRKRQDYVGYLLGVRLGKKRYFEELFRLIEDVA